MKTGWFFRQRCAPVGSKAGPSSSLSFPTRPFPSVLEWEEMHFCRVYLPILLALDVGRGVTMNFWQLPSWALVSGDWWCWMVPPFKTAVPKGG